MRHLRPRPHRRRRGVVRALFALVALVAVAAMVAESRNLARSDSQAQAVQDGTDPDSTAPHSPGPHSPVPGNTGAGNAAPNSTAPDSTAPASGAAEGALPGATGAAGPVGRVTAQSLREEFLELQNRFDGPMAVSWAPVGEPDAVQELGRVNDDDAWSTIKVPIAIAALDKADKADKAGKSERSDNSGTTPETQPSDALMGWVRAAVGESDNDAATSLWNSMGSSDSAATATTAVLRRSGDTRTETRAGRFGLTPWTIGAQTRFAAGLPCLSGAGRVIEAMEDHPDDQQWGLANTGLQASYKGGWGASSHGYLVRQMGVLTLPDGTQVAITLAASPRDGDHERATEELSTLAIWLAGHLSGADGGTCRTPR